MHHMVILVLDDLPAGPAVLRAWEDAGVMGITILESTGLGRIRRRYSFRDDLPLMPTLTSLLQSREENHRTFFTIVDGEAMVDELLRRTEEVLGPLTEPNKGLFFVVPVSRVVGLSAPLQLRNDDDDGDDAG